jgi:hypothetical protein
MQAPFEADRTWQSTMSLLSSEAETRLPIVASRVRPKYGEGHSAKCAIRVLERNSPVSATVAWRGFAKKAGVCALSGRTILTGDAVYRPRRVQPAPRNIEAMILATVMEAIPVEGV